jgi:hypothetical protein
MKLISSALKILSKMYILTNLIPWMKISNKHFKRIAVIGLQELRVIVCHNLSVISIRVTKPRIPKHIQENYEKIESEKTRFLIAT